MMMNQKILSKEEKMKKGIKIPIIFSVMVLLASSGFAQYDQRTMRRKGSINSSPARILVILKAKQKELKVTDSQIEKIKNLVFSFEEKMVQKRSEASLQRLELRKLMLDRENQDFEKIKEALTKGSNSRHDMLIERLKLRSEIQNVLTSEQQEALKELRKDRPRGSILQRRGKRPFQRGDRPERFSRMRNRIKR